MISFWYSKILGKDFEEALGLKLYFNNDEAYINGENTWIHLDKKNTVVDEPASFLMVHRIAIKVGKLNFKINADEGLANKFYNIFNDKSIAEPTVQSTSADELKKYKELLDSGAITQEEFDAKKKEILGL